MTDQRSSFKSERKNYRKAANPPSVSQDRLRHPFMTEARHTVWFCRTRRWQLSAVVKWERQLKHRWKWKR